MTDADTRKTTREPILSLHNVVKQFGNHRAVDHLTFGVYPGEIVSLLGPNGAGKTTTIEMCEGFQQPDSGTIRLFGMDPYQHSDQIRSQIGVMLQGGGGYPGIRVAEMLDLVASYSANPLDTEWLLKTVGLEQRRNTTYRRLSGGQQQRLALACALVNRPQLVFLDEPTAGLDAQSRMMVWDLVRSLRRDGVAVILTTHLMDEAEALSDRIIIIDQGEIVASGTPDQLPSSVDGSAAADSYQLTFAEDISPSELNDALSALVTDAESKVQVLAINRRQVTITGIDATSYGVLILAQAAANIGATIRTLDSNRQSLEEVFLTLTGREMRS